jgi:predicted double-glycine peptidase
MIERVQQKHSHGCGMAALAMVTGKTYDEVYAWFKNLKYREQGLSYHDVIDYLTEHGYAVNWKWMITHNEETNKPREIWPCEPWADMHIVQVENTIMYHFVVLLKDGTVLDPLTPEKKTLADYKRVTQMIAVYKILV